MLNLLRKTLEEAAVIKKADYYYFVSPLSDGIPQIEPALVNEVVEAVCELADLQCDKIVTVEAMGIPIGMALSLRTGIPLTVVRKRSYGLPGEVACEQVTGYSRGALYVNGIQKGERVLVIDDVLSTGGTLISVIGGLRSAGAIVKDVVVLIEKSALSKKRVEEAAGLPIKSLIRVRMEGGRVVVSD